jgi:hypothetical protein
MVDAATSPEQPELVGLTAAAGAVRELIDGAELDAGRTRADAARYARQRELEADLLVQKARRLLEAAEQMAAVIVATARTQVAAPSEVEVDQVIDLDEVGRIVAPDATVLGNNASPSRFDEMLASAIANAVTDAFPLDVPA